MERRDFPHGLVPARRSLPGSQRPHRQHAHRARHGHPSPWCTLGSLGTVHTGGLNKCVRTGVHPCVPHRAASLPPSPVLPLPSPSSAITGVSAVSSALPFPERQMPGVTQEEASVGRRPSLRHVLSSFLRVFSWLVSSFLFVPEERSTVWMDQLYLSSASLGRSWMPPSFGDYE